MKKYIKIGSLSFLSAIFLSISLSANNVNNVGKVENMVYLESSPKNSDLIKTNFMVSTVTQSIGRRVATAAFRFITFVARTNIGLPPNDTIQLKLDLSKFD